jgi:hypothetical protein
MAWLRIGDEYGDDAKIVAAGNACTGLHMRLMSWSCKHRTRGLVPAGTVLWYAAADGEGLVADAVTAGLLLPVEGGFELYNYAKHAPRDTNVEAPEDARRRRDRERKAAKRKAAKSAELPRTSADMSAEVPRTHPEQCVALSADMSAEVPQTSADTSEDVRGRAADMSALLARASKAVEHARARPDPIPKTRARSRDPEKLATLASPPTPPQAGGAGEAGAESAQEGPRTAENGPSETGSGEGKGLEQSGLEGPVKAPDERPSSEDERDPNHPATDEITDAPATDADGDDARADDAPQTKSARIGARHAQWAKLFADGIRDATGAPYVVPRTQYGELAEVIAAFGRDESGKALRKEALDTWLRASVAEYRRAVAGESPIHQSHFGPRGFAKWLSIGRPSADALCAMREGRASGAPAKPRTFNNGPVQRAEGANDGWKKHEMKPDQIEIRERLLGKDTRAAAGAPLAAGVATRVAGAAE